MWIAKFKLIHDCMFTNRCVKFGVSLQSIPLTVFRLRGKTYTSSLHHASGEKSSIDAFFADLKKERGVKKMESKGATLFVVEKTGTQAIQFHTPMVFFVKPVLMSSSGYELWEIASWEKAELTKFIGNIGRKVGQVQLVKLAQKPIANIFYPRLMPDLTKNQKQALELAIEEGYYQVPRKTGLRALAKLMGLSLSTYQAHLRKAEQKMIPNILYSSE